MNVLSKAVELLSDDGCIHQPWVGDLYEKEGIRGQRIAIVGYSHYVGDDEDDGVSYTIDTVKWAIKSRKISFFNAICSYFEFEDIQEFWSRVAFFNYIPWSVGFAVDRYAQGTDAQIYVAKERFLATLSAYKAHKVLVFTTKGWEQFPPTYEEQQEGQMKLPPLETSPKFTWGTYRFDGFVAEAFGLRHPQGAKKQEMINAVTEILARPIA